MTAAVSRWPKSIIHWRDNGTLNVSVPFTWMLPEAVAFCRAHSYTSRVRIGGPAVSLMPVVFMAAFIRAWAASHLAASSATCS